MSDSNLIGDLIAEYLDGVDGDDYFDLDGVDGDDVGDLIAEVLDGVDGEIGRRGRRRRKARRARRHHRGQPQMAVSPALMAAIKAGNARHTLDQMAQLKALAGGTPQTAGQMLATSSERIEYAPFDFQTLGQNAGDTVTITANIQRAIQPHRAILSAVDSITGQDVLYSVGVTAFQIGVRPVFNSVGVAPAELFSSRAVGVKLLSDAAVTGQQITMQLLRLAAVTNPSIVSGSTLGHSAQ